MVKTESGSSRLWDGCRKDVRKVLMMSVFALASTGFSAFDNNQVNGFWNTKGYVNPAPSVSGAEIAQDFRSQVFGRADGTLPRDSMLDSWCFAGVGPIALESLFRSISPGLSFVVR